MIKKTPVSIKYIMCICLLLPYIEPLGVKEMLELHGTRFIVINTIFNYGAIITLVLSLIWVLRMRINISMASCVIVAYYIYMAIRCFFRGLNSNGAISDLVLVSGMCLVLEIYRRVGMIIFIRSIASLLGITIFINFVSLFLYPSGIYINSNGWSGNWILGYYNLHIYVYIPWLCSVYILILHKYKNFVCRIALVSICVFIAIRIADSATSSVAIVVFVATCLFVLKANITPPNRIVSLLGAAILSLVIIVFNIQNYFQHLIVNILHRNITMTGRMQIWETASMKLKESWIFGNGYFIYYFPRGDITGQAHNTYLNILVVGGIVGLVLFFLIFLLNNKKAKNNNDHPYSKILRVGLMAYSVTFLTEMFKKPHFFIILIFLSYHIDEVIRQLPMPNSKLLSSEATHKNLLLRKRKC